MLSGHRSAGRRRNSRAARIAVPLAIPMALGLTLGIILAVSGNNTTTVEQSALGSCASAAASAPAPAASGSQAAAGGPGPRGQRPCRGCQRPGISRGCAVPVPVGIRIRRARGTVAGIPPINPPGGPGRFECGGCGRGHVQLRPDAGRGGGQHQLHDHRPGQPAQRPGPGDAVPPGCSATAAPWPTRAPGRVHRRHHPPRQRGAAGLQPPGHHPGDHPGRRAGGAEAARNASSPSTSGSTARLIQVGRRARQGHCVNGLGIALRPAVVLQRRLLLPLMATVGRPRPPQDHRRRAPARTARPARHA